MINRLILGLLLLSGFNAIGQDFTRADTLRGSLSEIRSCFDVTFYHLDIKLDIENQSLSGSNEIRFTATSTFDSLQIDLFENMEVDSIAFEGKALEYNREFTAVYVKMGRTIMKSEQAYFEVFYHGSPIIAKNAPWDGGFVWKKDFQGNPWVGVACEGDGASLWWPNKDHLSDEPDSMRISLTVPDSLMGVCNGDLISVDTLGADLKYNWLVMYPINSYNVTINVADYVHFDDVHINENGDSLRLDYYVLPDNLEKAKAQFKQVNETLKCFETAFGSYPFFKDGYALVETAYLGMEHQGAIAYGNKYEKGYRGRFTGDLDFDYIIIHETGHEWWGNSVSATDVADLWIHESFCTYSEAVFVECKYGYDKMLEYLIYQKEFINNNSPIQGPMHVNRHGNATDMYYKGSWMIHTLRNVLGVDHIFKPLLKELALNFFHQTVNADDVINFINGKTDDDLTGFFEQYLTVKEVPVLEYRVKRRKFFYRWRAIEGFNMPVELYMGEIDRFRINPTSEWASIEFKPKMLRSLKFRTDLFLFEAEKVVE
ncbi:MAG: aminopeptidase N [Bacteroidia bacterium]|jgi:aminopeptidase N